MWATVLAGGVLAACLAVAPAGAQDKAGDKPAIELTEEEKREQEGRKVCKIKLCDAFLNKRADGGDISCGVVKTWRKERLAQVMSKGKLSWPWGLARCKSDIKLSRALLVKAMSEPKLEADIGKHNVHCEVEREAEKDKYELTFAISPKVTFENGKAVKAKLGWGEISGTTAAKGALWTASAMDNTFNVLQSTVIEEINDFIGPKCAEVKDELPK